VAFIKWLFYTKYALDTPKHVLKLGLHNYPVRRVRVISVTSCNRETNSDVASHRIPTEKSIVIEFSPLSYIQHHFYYPMFS
jgi:hypothetical protein